MIEWVNNDDNDNDEDANLICFLWQLCELFIEKEHKCKKWCEMIGISQDSD